jgi:hypothetical protein
MGGHVWVMRNMNSYGFSNPWKVLEAVLVELRQDCNAIKTEKAFLGLCPFNKKFTFMPRSSSDRI